MADSCDKLKLVVIPRNENVLHKNGPEFSKVPFAHYGQCLFPYLPVMAITEVVLTSCQTLFLENLPKMKISCADGFLTCQNGALRTYQQ
jgi:hypothetical protein